MPYTAPQPLPTSLEPRLANLTTLRERLFSTYGTPPAGTVPPAAMPAVLDRSVTLTEHTHRHQEVATCIRELKQLLPEMQPRDIAIVVRDPAAYQPLLLEEADRQQLPVSLSLPPRLLLLTPLGRFALTLYEIWRDGALHMTADQFETILASGWLGAHIQRTTDRFNAVKDHMFGTCTARTQRMDNIKQLRLVGAQQASDSRLATRAIDEQTADLWRAAIRQIHALCSRLFAAGNRDIGGHIRTLLDELDAFAPEDMLATERAVLLRIREALLQVAEESSLQINPTEFGSVLNGLVQEYQRPAEEERAPDDNRIWVTMPEGIDGNERAIVYYLGVDDQHAPMHSRSAWPFDRSDPDGIAGHHDEERYLFLTVVRAARTELHLSYARRDGDDRFGPSLYLEDAAALLNTTIVRPTDPPPTITTPTPTPASDPLDQAWRSTYTLAELAHAALCPYRYSLECLDPAARQYRGKFQTRFLAQALWLDAIMRRLKTSGAQALGADGTLTMLRNAMAATRPALRASFPGMSEADWKTVAKYVERNLWHVAKDLKPFPVRVVDGATDQIVVPIGDRSVTVQSHVRHALQVGRYRYPFFQDLLREEWLKPGATPPTNMPPTVIVAGLPLATTQYHAEDWQRRATKTVFNHARLKDGPPPRTPGELDRAKGVRNDYADLQIDLAARITAIQAGRYPKYPGDHCTTCPVRRVCFGREL